MKILKGVAWLLCFLTLGGCGSKKKALAEATQSEVTQGVGKYKLEMKPTPKGSLLEPSPYEFGAHEWVMARFEITTQPQAPQMGVILEAQESELGVDTQLVWDHNRHFGDEKFLERMRDSVEAKCSFILSKWRYRRKVDSSSDLGNASSSILENGILPIRKNQKNLLVVAPGSYTELELVAEPNLTCHLAQKPGDVWEVVPTPGILNSENVRRFWEILGYSLRGSWGGRLEIAAIEGTTEADAIALTRTSRLLWKRDLAPENSRIGSMAPGEKRSFRDEEAFVYPGPDLWVYPNKNL